MSSLLRHSRCTLSWLLLKAQPCCRAREAVTGCVTRRVTRGVTRRRIGCQPRVQLCHQLVQGHSVLCLGGHVLDLVAINTCMALFTQLQHAHRYD